MSPARPPFFLTPMVLIVEKFLRLSQGNIMDCKYCFVGISVCLHWKKRISKRRKNMRPKLGNNANFLICVYAGFCSVLAAPLTGLTYSENGK